MLSNKCHIHHFIDRLGCTLLATYSVTSAFTTLTEEDFELFAMRNVGRGAMVAFTGLVTAGILGV